MRPWGSISHNASFLSQLFSEAIWSWLWRQVPQEQKMESRPTVKLSNLVTEIGKNSLFNYKNLFGFLEGDCS